MHTYFIMKLESNYEGFTMFLPTIEAGRPTLGFSCHIRLFETL
jgi:hypothetical protein